jgi:DNA-binding SARP family transcriptional activator/DNA-binding GntR family transcriptional regulator
MEFRVLGPLEASDGKRPFDLGGHKQRAVLARLLLDLNRTVAVDRLVDDLWGEDTPASAVKMVQISVSRLRKVLPAGVLLTRAPGYVLQADPEALDAIRFRRLRESGRAALASGDAVAAAGTLREALTLWRGSPLAEFDEPFARVEAAHLEEMRVVCLEERIDAELALGRHAGAVAELEALVAGHPLREGLHRQLMLALYRGGRQGEALAAYERFRRTLDQELGIEPTGALKALHLRILNQDPGLDADPRNAVRRAPDATAPAPAQARAPVERRLVGRTEELRALESALDEAAGCRGGSVLVAGPAGIGKTRLLAELVTRAHERGATVLTGRCIQLIGAGLPYLPLVEALRPLHGSTELRGLADVLHELPRLMPGLTREDAVAQPVETRASSRLRLFEEMLAVLERLGAQAPVVLVLEDLHWADESTLDFVAFLVHSVADRRILFLTSYRSDEVRPGDPLQRLVTGLSGGRTVRTLPLPPLPHDAVMALIAAGGGDTLPGAVAAEIAERAEGNPFFAVELRVAAERGEPALPPAMRDLLLARIADLDATGRAVLRIAAAAGRDVSFALLAAVMPMEELVLAEALREAVDHGVLEPVHATGSFRFRHALFADAVYGTLLPGERELTHERLARALTEEPELAATGAAAAEPAHHWAAAGRPVEALVASLRAAREAEAVSGLAEALRHVERVLELWDEVADAEELAGLALPSVLEWAAELVGSSAERDDALDARVLVGVLGPGESFDVEGTAQRLGVTRDEAAAALTALERDRLVDPLPDGTYRSAPLAVAEARRLYPSAVVLESLALRVSSPFGRSGLAALRRANARLLQARNDAPGAVAADDEFHRLLVAGCDNEHLLAALRPIKRALLRYERVYMLDPARIERSAGQHDAIVAALESGDHAAAAQLVRQNLAHGLPDLAEALER